MGARAEGARRTVGLTGGLAGGPAVGKKTTGTPPPGLINSACASIGSNLYHFGGSNGRGSFSSALSLLDTSTMEWKLLTPDIGPMKKQGAGMVAFHGNKLALFGGFGIPTSSTQPGTSFERISGESGYTNEFHIFNISNGVLLLIMAIDVC